MAEMLLPGDAAPWFHAPVIGGRPRFAFDSLGGRIVVLLFAGSSANPGIAAALGEVAAHRRLFDDHRALFFAITGDPDDIGSLTMAPRVAADLPGIRWFDDSHGAIAAAFGATGGAVGYRPHWLLIDRQLRVAARGLLGDGAAILALAERLAAQPFDLPAPVLAVPNILDRATCAALIAGFDADGGSDSGMMVERDGITTGVIDHQFKRRRDWLIDDPALRQRVGARLRRFLLPMLERTFQFRATRIERWLVARYDDADGGGHFAAHRDNTTAGTAHRRFACTINLNAEAHDGGALVFPEYGPRQYKASTGGAVVFSCALLHQALPVTRGVRYALLPFFYDDAAAALREANIRQVAPENAGYRADAPASAADDPDRLPRVPVEG